MSKELPISSRKHFGLVALVDPEDFERLARFKWHYSLGYAYRTDCQSGRNRTIRMHREILDAPKGSEVDHKNGNRLDNRRENLRFVTRSQNAQNLKGARSDSRTGIRNVYLTANGQYQVRLWKDGQEQYLGSYDSIEDAERRAVAARRIAFPFNVEL